MPQNRQTVKRTHRPVSTAYPMGYVDGNTVRKLEPAPYERKVKTKEQLRWEREEARRKARQKENKEIAVRNRAKVLKIDLRYTLFLGAAVIATLFMCIYYLGLQSQLTTQNKTISSLKSQLTSLTDANQATQERLNNAIDLDKVFEVATNELGMGYPTKNQIIYYSSSSNDYVKQYKDIPQSGQ